MNKMFKCDENITVKPEGWGETTGIHSQNTAPSPISLSSHISH